MIVEALVDTTGIGNFDQAVAATMLVNGEFVRCAHRIFWSLL